MKKTTKKKAGRPSMGKPNLNTVKTGFLPLVGTGAKVNRGNGTIGVQGAVKRGGRKMY